MPMFREVPTLQALCTTRFSNVVVSMRSRKVPNHQYDLQNSNILKMQLEKKKMNDLCYIMESHVPWHLCQLVAHEVLQTIANLLEKNDINDVVALRVTAIVMNAKLKHVNLPNWPRVMWKFFYENLYQMVGLETLNLGCWFPRLSSFHDTPKVLTALKTLTNLRSVCVHFHCTDDMIQVISKSCRHIKSIDVYLSQSVTDRSVRYFLKCRELRKLQLIGTSISERGHACLISYLRNLENIGMCDSLKLIRKYLNSGPYDNIKRLSTRDVTNKTLGFVAQYFPKLEGLSLIFNVQTPDLTELDQLKYLKELLIGWVPRNLKSFNPVLKIIGHKLTHLHLDNFEAIPSNTLTVIGNSCPNLTSLVIYKSDFLDDRFSVEPAIQLRPHSFNMLESLFWVVENSTNLLEVILSNAGKIKYIHVGHLSGIEHSNLVNILRVNQMKLLKDLRVWYSKDMSMKTVELLLGSCPNLKVLSDLESWKGISNEELVAFKDLIREKNFDLNISPIWVEMPYCCESYLTL